MFYTIYNLTQRFITHLPAATHHFIDYLLGLWHETSATLTPSLHIVNSYIWGGVTLFFLISVGLYLTIGLKAFPWRNIPSGLYHLWAGRKPSGQAGNIPPFKSLMTALSATVGTGNIAGVATAIYLGGPGALFWMWMAALVGMATKYAEAVLAIEYREVNENGDYVGGPMYYIKKGLPKYMHFLAFLFALFGMFAAFGIGNMVQTNTLATALGNSFAIPAYLIGGIVTVIIAAVILGGLRRIALFASALVPLMCAIYLVLTATVLIAFADRIPEALMLVVDSAFNGTAATGGFAGAGVAAAIQFGIARGVFSNEAGMGSASIVHAAAQTSSPVRQGKIAMLGTFIDTIIVCSLTGLAILVTGVWKDGQTGVLLSADAFNTIAPWLGNYILPVVISIFAITTVFGWAYYGERCFCYIFHEKNILVYRLFWIVAAFTGAVVGLDLVWTVADIMNGLMIWPNLIALLLLSPVVFKLTRKYKTSPPA